MSRDTNGDILVTLPDSCMSGTQPVTADRRHDAGDALQLVRAAVLERDAGADDEILHGRRHEDLAGSASDITRAAMFTPRPATSVPTSSISPVCSPAAPTRPRLRTPSRIATAAADRTRGPVERREDAVARRLDEPPVEPLELPPDERLVRLERVAASCASPASAAISVERTMSVNNTVARTRSVDGGRISPGEELLDHVEDRASCPL